jgi:hypothetical protein
MSTLTPASRRTLSRPERRSDGFVVVSSEATLGRNLPQKLGSALWAPFAGMALLGFGAAIALTVVRAGVVAASPDDVVRLLQLQHLTTAAMFAGFTSAFSAIAFAIARILGVLRADGGRLQADVGSTVLTLRMPGSAKLMLVTMTMGMMAITGAVIVHVALALGTSGATDLMAAHRSLVALEGVRRVGVALHLVAIVLGLATIRRVITFQTMRLRELAVERTTS